MNIGMIVMHWFLSADVNRWIKFAPMPSMAKEEAAPVKEEAAATEDADEDAGSATF